MRSVLVLCVSLLAIGCGGSVQRTRDECAGIDCGRGSCVVENGGPVCACDPSFHADGLTCVADTACVDCDGGADAGDAGLNEITCTDEDGDYFTAEDHADASAICAKVCGPRHNEVCQGGADCDDDDAAKTATVHCSTHSVVGGALYVTNLGDGDHSGSSFRNAMGVAEHNARTFEAGSTIYIAETITIADALRPPSSGEEGKPIIYRGDHPEHPGTLSQHAYPEMLSMMFIRNKVHLTIIGLAFVSDITSDKVTSRAALWIEELEEPTGHIAIADCIFNKTITGVFIRGDTQHVSVVRSTFEFMTGSGVGVGKYYGRPSEMPSFITVGGSRENGNTFRNVGRMEEYAPGAVPGQAMGTQVNDALFSYNHVHADEPGWGTGIYLNGVDRVVIEHNWLHDLDSLNRRAPITFKTDSDWINTDIVIRFNKVGPTHGGGTYTTPQAAIRFGHNLDNVVVYGNYVVDVQGIGIMSDWGWGDGGGSDGSVNRNVFVYSNIIARTGNGSGIYLSGVGGIDYFENTYLTNNLIYHAVDEDPTKHWSSCAIHSQAADHNFKGLTIKNNIIDSSRDRADDLLGIRANEQDDMSVDYNHHYFPGGKPTVYYRSSSCGFNDPSCLYGWDSADVPNGYDAHGSEGIPGYTDEANADFTLGSGESPCVDSGEALTVAVPSLTIQGRSYSFDIGEVLNPYLTNWKPTIPFVHTTRQSDHGDWEKGPYAFIEGD